MTQDPHKLGPLERLQRDRGVRRVLWVVLGLNIIVAVAKLVTGYAIGSLSLVADGFHSSLDGTSNVVGLVGLGFAAAPPDRDHPYGHRRFETFASLVIGVLIAGGLFEITKKIYEGIVETRPPVLVTWSAVLVVVTTIGINAFISRYETRKGRQYQSAILIADSKHTLTDTYGALAVLASFGLGAAGVPYADLGAAFVVAFLIMSTAYQVIAPNFRILVDSAPIDPADIARVARSVEGVYGSHKERSRGSLDHLYIDLHIQVDPQMTVVDAHALTHRVADAIRAEFTNVYDVLIHTEPHHP